MATAVTSSCRGSQAVHHAAEKKLSTMRGFLTAHKPFLTSPGAVEGQEESVGPLQTFEHLHVNGAF